jgi:hypothetical protein
MHQPDVIVLKIPIATIVFSVLLRFTHSDYPFGIFKLFLTYCWKHLQWELIMFRCIFKRLSTTFEELVVVHFRAGWSLRWVDTLCFAWCMVIKVILNNSSATSWRSVLLLEETGVPGKRPSIYRKSLTNFITYRVHHGIRTHKVSSDRHR